MTKSKSHNFILERSLQIISYFDCCSVIELIDKSMWYSYKRVFVTFHLTFIHQTGLQGFSHCEL